MGNKIMRRIRTSLVLLVAAAAAVVGLGTPAGAQPGHGSYEWCFEISEGHWICVPVWVNWDWRWNDCPQCGLKIDWRNDDIINPEVEGSIDQLLGRGLQDLSQAALTTDRALQARLRADALTQLTQAAKTARSAKLTVSQVGGVDLETLRFEPQPVPWLQAAGADLADAVTLMQSALANPASADRYRALAAAQFDEAFNEMATQKAIGS